MMSNKIKATAPAVSQTQSWNEYLPEAEEDDGASDDASDFLLSKPPPKKVAKTSKNKIWWCQAVDSSGNSYYADSQKYTKAVWEIAEQEWGGKEENGVFFLMGPYRETKKNKVQTYRCAFYHQAQCKKPAYRVVYSKSYVPNQMRQFGNARRSLQVSCFSWRTQSCSGCKHLIP